MKDPSYMVIPGPEAFLPPPAAAKGVELPGVGEALVEGRRVALADGMRAAVEKLLGARNPVLFPGPLLLWTWSEGVAEKAAELRKLADTVGAKIIPMPDYRPKYPMINPAAEINPNHPNLTIWHNKIDVCLFIGVHCHYANVALKIIRGGTDCYTIAVCAEKGHEDAMISFRDAGLAELRQMTLLARGLREVA